MFTYVLHREKFASVCRHAQVGATSLTSQFNICSRFSWRMHTYTHRCTYWYHSHLSLSLLNQSFLTFLCVCVCVPTGYAEVKVKTIRTELEQTMTQLCLNMTQLCSSHHHQHFCCCFSASLYFISKTLFQSLLKQKPHQVQRLQISLIHNMSCLYVTMIGCQVPVK